jgi:hypothetical protein
MTTSRRDFVEKLATGAVLFGATPAALAALPVDGAPAPIAGEWDLSWTDRLRGRYKVVVDSPEISEGAAVFRATAWSKHYGDAMGTRPEETSTVLVLRHNAIPLVMNHAYWAEYAVGEKDKVNDPVTNKPAVRNPVMLNSKEHGSPAMFDEFALDRFLSRGGIVLGCSLAFADMIGRVKEKDKVSDAAAKEKATKMMIPGVILQPSGVFAVVRAQQAGCWFMMGS